MVWCPNVYDIKLSQKPEATLSKKHNSITHLKIRETVVSGMIRVEHVNNLLNVVDILTKALLKAKRDALIDPSIYQQVSFAFAFSFTICILHWRKRIPFFIWDSGIIIPVVCN
jgi:hypothetical protein